MSQVESTVLAISDRALPGSEGRSGVLSIEGPRTPAARHARCFGCRRRGAMTTGYPKTTIGWWQDTRGFPAASGSPGDRPLRLVDDPTAHFPPRPKGSALVAFARRSIKPMS